jgi:uncharacterized delta-60 repeat protein
MTLTKNIMLRKPLSLIVLLCLGCLSLNAQHPGDLDPTFGADGKRIVPVGAGNAFGRDIIIQPDGKIIMACIASNGTDTDFAIARFTAGGDPDVEFDGDGIVLTDFDGKSDVAQAVVLDQHDRIIVAGYVDTGDGFAFAVARYSPDGLLDETFGDHGLVTRMVGETGFCRDLAIQEDNKIVLGGYAIDPFSQTNEYIVMRFLTDGTPDSTFHEDGLVQTNMGIGAGVANALLIQPDKKIVLAGQVFNEATFRWQIGVARYNEDGSTDDTWGEDGIVFTGKDQADFTIKAVTIDADQHILVGGHFGTAPSNTVFAVARYHDDGQPDDTFGDEGLLLNSYGAENSQINTILTQPDGQILIAGGSLQGSREFFAVARLHPDGNLDDSFGNGGITRPVMGNNDGINSIVLQKDGKLVVVGEAFNGQKFEMALARFETGIKTSIGEGELSLKGVTVFPNPLTEILTVSFSLSKSSYVQIDMYDSSGAILHSFSNSFLYAREYVETYMIPTSLLAGVYYLGINTGMEMATIRLVVVKK